MLMLGLLYCRCVIFLLGFIRALLWRVVRYSLRQLAKSSEKRGDHALAAGLRRAADQLVAEFGGGSAR
jgi:hypothetical protein